MNERPSATEPVHNGKDAFDDMITFLDAARQSDRRAFDHTRLNSNITSEFSGQLGFAER
jgi:hypothetical protein